MHIISQETRAWEREEYGDLRDPDLEGVHCWFCGEKVEDQAYAETTVDVDGLTMWVPVCDACDPPRLACPACNQTLAPPRRHSCGGAAPGYRKPGAAEKQLRAIAATIAVAESI
jgi:hypothetical protein